MSNGIPHFIVTRPHVDSRVQSPTSEPIAVSYDRANTYRGLLTIRAVGWWVIPLKEHNQNLPRCATHWQTLAISYKRGALDIAIR
jgi:hypothetical protein